MIAHHQQLSQCIPSALATVTQQEANGTSFMGEKVVLYEADTVDSMHSMLSQYVA